MKTNSLNCAPKGTTSRFMSIRTALTILLFSCLFVPKIIAQTTTTFPPVDRCTSKDLSLVSATLTGGDACNSCTPGTSITRTLVLGINNKTGSTRYAFAFWGNLTITHADGTTSVTSINRCDGPIPPTGPLPAYYSGGNFGTITYTCGDTLMLTDLYLAWTDASRNSVCSSVQSALIAPKCGTLPSIQINAGVNGGFAVTNATCSTLGQIVVTPFGGTGPYTVVLGSVTRTNVTTSTTFTNLGVGTYTFTITDALGCHTTMSRSITSSGSVATPSCLVTQPSCTVATATATVQSPASGVTYTLRQSGNIIYTANSSGVFSNVATGTYALVGVLGTCSATGSNVVVDSQPATPAKPSICVVQPSLCGPAVGSVTVTAPLGAGIEYSIDNGTTWQSSNVFNNLAAGSVTGIRTRQNGCVSAASSCSDSNCSTNRVAQNTPVQAAPEEVQNDKINFDVAPVPFKDLLNITYKFNYKSNVNIEVFNAAGTLIYTTSDTNGYYGKEISLNMDKNLDKNQLYVIRLTTKKGTTTKKVFSSK